MALLNVVDRIGIEADKIKSLITDLESPAQNPVYKGPTNENIIEVLKNVLDIFASAQIEIEDLNNDLNYYITLSEE